MNARFTNYPISKNLIYLALQMYRSMIDNEKFYIDPSDYRSNCAEPNIFLHGKNDWYPWLWSRVPQRTSDTETGWELYFSNFDDVELTGNQVQDFLNCCSSIFRPRMELIDDHILNTDKKIIGCHFRRGDCCSFANSESKRKPFSDYVNFIRQYDSNEYCIYIASESIDMVYDEIGNALDEYDIFHSKYSEKIKCLSNLIETDIEVYSLENEYKQIVYDIMISGIIDMYNLSNSSALIAPYTVSSYSSFSALLAYNKNCKTFYDVSTHTLDTKVSNYICFDLESLINFNPIRF